MRRPTVGAPPHAVACGATEAPSRYLTFSCVMRGIVAKAAGSPIPMGESTGKQQPYLQAPARDWQIAHFSSFESAEAAGGIPSEASSASVRCSVTECPHVHITYSGEFLGWCGTRSCSSSAGMASIMHRYEVHPHSLQLKRSTPKTSRPMTARRERAEDHVSYFRRPETWSAFPARV